MQVEEVVNIMNLARKNNINVLDTAAGYGNSEEILGRVDIGDFQVVTKTAPLKLGVDNVLQSFYSL